jgi:hypothetical protein
MRKIIFCTLLFISTKALSQSNNEKNLSELIETIDWINLKVKKHQFSDEKIKIEYELNLITEGGKYFLEIIEDSYWPVILVTKRKSVVPLNEIKPIWFSNRGYDSNAQYGYTLHIEIQNENHSIKEENVIYSLGDNKRINKIYKTSIQLDKSIDDESLRDRFKNAFIKLIEYSQTVDKNKY